MINRLFQLEDSLRKHTANKAAIAALFILRRHLHPLPLFPSLQILTFFRNFSRRTVPFVS